MAYMLRVIPSWVWFLVGVLMSAVPQFAYADTYQAVFYLAVGTGKYPDASSWFGAWAPTQSTCTTSGCSCSFTSSYTSGNQEIVTYNRVCPGLNNNPTTGTVWNAWCPGGGTLSGTYPTTQCINATPCPEGQVRGSDGICAVPPSPCEQYAGQYWGDGNQAWRTSKPWEPSWMSGSGSSGLPDVGCWNQCEVDLSDRDFGGSGSGKWYMSVYIKATGNGCAPGAATPEAPPKPPNTSPEYDCAKNGQGFGTVNGTVICTGPATDTKTEKTDTTKTTNPDNSTSETTTKKECTGNTCTTTTTTCTKDAAGNSTGCTTTSTTESGPDTGTGKDDGGGGGGQGDGPESKFGGTCGSAPACSGDAIQCATAKSVWEMNCRYRAGDGMTLAEKITTGQDPKAGQMPWAEGNAQSVNLSTSFNSTEVFSASCVPDISFAGPFGRTVTVPLSTHCTWLGWIGNLMLAGCMLWGVSIALGRSQ